MKTSRYWVAFGDVHDDISRLDGLPELAGAYGVLITGDITFAGGVRKAEKVLSAIQERMSGVHGAPRLLAQVGNMDKPEVTDWLEEKGWNLHRHARELFPGVWALGLGCSPPTPFHTPSEYGEEQLARWMNEAAAEAGNLAGAMPPGESLVLVSHAPPVETKCDKLDNGTSVGSRAVRAFIEERRPALCLCGHIHESVGEDSVGPCRVINPGPLKDGGYVILTENTSGGAPFTHLKFIAR